MWFGWVGAQHKRAAKSRVPCDPGQGCHIQGASIHGTGTPTEGPEGTGDQQHTAHKPCPFWPEAARAGAGLFSNPWSLGLSLGPRQEAR